MLSEHAWCVRGVQKVCSALACFHLCVLCQAKVSLRTPNSLGCLGSVCFVATVGVVIGLLHPCTLRGVRTRVCAALLVHFLPRP